MAAVIQYASRRLVNYVLQRTQTELPRRLIHSGPPPAASCRRPIHSGATHPPISNAELPAARPQDGKMDALRQIRKKKEELYDQIAMTERTYDTGLWGKAFRTGSCSSIFLCKSNLNPVTLSGAQTKEQKGQRML